MKQSPRIIVGQFLMDTFFKNGPQNGVTPEYLQRMVEANFLPQNVRAGYRDGVIQVSLSLEHERSCAPYWMSNIVKLQNGDYLFGKFKERTGGEDPRKSVTVLAQPNRLLPVESVDAILYHRDVLAETEPQDEGFDYEIVKVNIKVTKGEQPMPPETLIANHFRLSGGTSTNMTPEQFEAALKESVAFWKDKAYIHGGD